LIEQNRFPVPPNPRGRSRIGRQNKQDDGGLKTIGRLGDEGLSRSDFAILQKHPDAGAALQKLRQVPRKMVVLLCKTRKHRQHGG
jgi:hypothetical protein